MNDREEDIFDKARKFSSPEERGQYLHEACGHDAPLRDRIQALVEAHHHPIPILSGPATAAFPDIFPTTNDSSADSGESPLSQAPFGGVLGDFTLIREIGRGGMGVIYEAWQASLNRKVALKVLPFAAVLDQRQLKRFETETKAAAGLHHGNIVPVYQVGSDRGVHFYAMQFIAGQDVAKMISQLRQIARKDDESPPQSQSGEQGLASSIARGRFDPAVTTRLETAAARVDESLQPATRPPSQSIIDTQPLAALSTEDATNRPEYFRTITHLGIQAVEALDFAHQRGILHRDIKPSNLMLDTDGKLWITDFGLARVEGDAGLTMTGDLMGTLRYMSPEQAFAQRDGVDHRSDIYSLGVTLYELLTLQPTYPGKDRNELLQQLAHQEPVPPRQINKAIPLDLETVVLKAMAKAPEDRYATAQELADDLRRYLNNEPILARRATLSARGTKWIRRNRTLVTLSFVTAFIGGVVAASIVVVVKDREGNVVATSTYPDAHSVTVENGDESPPPSLASKATPAIPPLAGLLPDPQQLPEIGRWQITSTRPTYSHRVWRFAWRPQGQFMALCSGHDLRVYKVPSFELVHIFCGHTSDLRKVAWSPDGTQIASASDDGTVRIWDFETGTPGAVLIGHTNVVRAVDWHPDGVRLATADADGELRIWTRDGKALAVWRGSGVSDLDWSPDGKLLASAGTGTIYLWNDQGQRQAFLEPNHEWTISVAWSPDGTRLLTAGSGGVRIWEADGTPGPVFSGHTRHLRCAAWSLDGRQIASVADDAKLCIWDVENSAKTTVDVNQGQIEWVAWSPDGRYIATSSAGKVDIWDTSGRAVAGLPWCLRVRTARLSPDDQKLAANIGTGEEFHMLLCNADGSDAQFLDDLIGYPLDFDWTPDSQSILVGGGQPSLRLCGRDGSAGLVLDEDSNWERGIRSLSVSPNGKLAVVHQEDDAGKNTVQIWNLDGTPGPNCAAPTDILGRPVWSPQGDRIAATSVDHKLRIWTSDGELQETLVVGVWSSEVLWKPDGSEIACIGEQARVWDGTGRQIAVLSGSEIGNPPWQWAVPLSSKFSPNYSRGSATTIRYHDPQTGELSWIMAVTRNEQVVKFSPDGRVMTGISDVVDREFAYIIEKPTGAIEIVKPSEFGRRYFHEPEVAGSNPVAPISGG